MKPVFKRSALRQLWKMSHRRETYRLYFFSVLLPVFVLIKPASSQESSAKVLFYFHLSALTSNNFRTPRSQFFSRPPLIRKEKNSACQELWSNPSPLALLATDLTTRPKAYYLWFEWKSLWAWVPKVPRLNISIRIVQVGA